MFDPTECKRVVDAETRMVSCPVEAGTLIVSRMNTPDRVGACGFVPGDRTNLFLPDRLWKVKLTPEVDPYLIFVLLVSASYKARLKGMASGTSGSMHNIPKDSFGNLDVTLPRESKEQRTIGSMFEQLDNLITLHQRKRQWLKWLDEGGEGTHHDIDILVFKFADDMKISVLCGVHACMTKSLGHTGNRYAGKQQQRGMGVP